MKKIGFVTSEEDPNLIDDDRLVFSFLEANSISVQPIVWDRFDQREILNCEALVFRSCWNYHRKYSEFLRFLDDLKSLKIPVFNPLDILQWNLNKKHILEFEQKILIPKTKWLQSETGITAHQIKTIAQECFVDQIVVKPAVSLNGQDTYLLSLSNITRIEEIILSLLKDRDVLIQEFIPEIQTQGEISLIYFNKKFSHAIRKIPAQNEFRVHSEYGGKKQSTKASEQSLLYARTILNEIKSDLLYARVDLVESKRGPILIELELTDPMLYLATQEDAAQNFAKAVCEMLLV